MQQNEMFTKGQKVCPLLSHCTLYLCTIPGTHLLLRPGCCRWGRGQNPSWARASQKVFVSGGEQQTLPGLRRRVVMKIISGLKGK